MCTAATLLQEGGRDMPELLAAVSGVERCGKAAGTAQREPQRQAGASYTALLHKRATGHCRLCVASVVGPGRSPEPWTVAARCRHCQASPPTQPRNMQQRAAQRQQVLLGHLSEVSWGCRDAACGQG